MSRAPAAVLLVVAVGGATVLFWLLVHRASRVWLDVALRPEVRQVMQQSLDDQKRLRQLDPARREEYRQNFERTSRLIQRLDVVRMSRERMLRRFEAIVTALFAAAASFVALWVALRARRMRTRERREFAERLADMQQNARRNAHELKGPLTAARLELERATDAISRGDEVAPAIENVQRELQRLSRLTRDHTEFASIGAPVLRDLTLDAFVAEFCATFAGAWPGLALQFHGGRARVCADADLVRQVLVNLCANSARAIEGEGAVRFTIARREGRVALDVHDTGRGIPEALRLRVFDPYVTTRPAGEGIGLGLAISRKILLDHGGDLALVASSPAGTTFRLTFGDDPCN